MNFNNKTVWITGASSGIGKELAIQFAQLGAQVILSARNVAKLEQLRSELNGAQHKNIHCLTICPGSIKTAIAHNSLDEHGIAQNKAEHSIENGMDVTAAVKQMVSAIAKRKDEVVVGEGISGWAPTIKRFFPSFFNRMTTKKNYR